MIGNDVDDRGIHGIASHGNGRLTEEQATRFSLDGYIIIRDIFKAADLEPLRQEFSDTIAESISILRKGNRIVNTYPDLPFERRAAEIYRDSSENGNEVVKKLQGRESGKYNGVAMFRLLTHSRLLNCLESLLGPEIVASSVARIRARFPGPGIGWHQDSAFYNPDHDQNTVVTCWIPLVDATAENGCLRIHPRAHLHGPICHLTNGNGHNYGPSIPDHLLPTSDPVIAAVPLGGVVLFTSMTPHCAPENRSDHMRWSVDFRYQSAHSPNNAHLAPDAPREVLNQACFPPEADCMVLSRSTPNTCVDHPGYIARREAFSSATGLTYPERWNKINPSLMEQLMVRG